MTKVCDIIYAEVDC